MADIVRLLVDYGHSYAKAHEIALDAIRGDRVSVEWVKIISDSRNS